MSLRQEVRNLGNQIHSDIDHGEVFYEKHYLDHFLAALDKLKASAEELYEQNQQERDNE